MANVWPKYNTKCYALYDKIIVACIYAYTHYSCLTSHKSLWTKNHVQDINYCDLLHAACPPPASVHIRCNVQGGIKMVPSYTKEFVMCGFMVQLLSLKLAPIHLMWPLCSSLCSQKSANTAHPETFTTVHNFTTYLSRTYANTDSEEFSSLWFSI